MLLKHLRTKAPYEADMTPEFPTKNFSSPTNVRKSFTNALWPRPLDQSWHVCHNWTSADLTFSNLLCPGLPICLPPPPTLPSAMPLPSPNLSRSQSYTRTHRETNILSLFLQLSLLFPFSVNLYLSLQLSLFPLIFSINLSASLSPTLSLSFSPPW